MFRVTNGAGAGAPFPVSSTITAYSGLNGSGDVLGTITGGVTGGLNFGYSTLALSGLNGAQSFTFLGAAGVAPRYHDITATVFVATPVPEAATWMMMIGELRSQRRGVAHVIARPSRSGELPVGAVPRQPRSF